MWSMVDVISCAEPLRTLLKEAHLIRQQSTESYLINGSWVHLRRTVAHCTRGNPPKGSKRESFSINNSGTELRRTFAQCNQQKRKQKQTSLWIMAHAFWWSSLISSAAYSRHHSCHNLIPHVQLSCFRLSKLSRRPLSFNAHWMLQLVTTYC